ncbi:MAG: phosphoribosylaminoimidazole carboxylase [Gammaproteobacteria bacterium HGW-Gammaproteobacteria-3]|nr:MAG: phosphoribosylaminoimidazole carboxylase [Gammaproteobacteria bacterium HGW-Gammaproteobacteria-3]
MTIANIFADIPVSLTTELFEDILINDVLHIERIVSQGHVTAQDQWYDQDFDEWVLLVQGKAIVCYENNAQQVTLNPGDYCLIPAHTRHRVQWTEPLQNTIWLAIHLLSKGAVDGQDNIDKP